MFKNSVTQPYQLTVAQVSAVINNTFSPGYPITATGDPAIRIPTGNLSNLSFELVDGNFKPLRLLNPLYLTLQVNPADPAPTEDISQWNGKLPKDAPTPEQAEQMRQQKEAEEAQQKQFQASMSIGAKSPAGREFREF
jgi:hypothetical protein